MDFGRMDFGRRDDSGTSATAVADTQILNDSTLILATEAATQLDETAVRRSWSPVGHRRILDRYILCYRVGSGGFSTVFAAHDTRLDRLVAIKAIPRGRLDIARVEREALAAARLDHPAIVVLFDVAEEDDTCYLISELVEGSTLADLCKQDSLSDRDVVRIGYVLADALAHAHSRGVIHRDVKPQNVLVPSSVAEGGAAAKLTDFGIALLAEATRLTSAGDFVGTLAYMAPEQANSEPADERVDIYSLGVVLYEAFSGTNPVRADSPAATARRIGQPFTPLKHLRRDLPDHLCSAIDRCVSADPKDRGELADLKEALTEDLSRVSDSGRSLTPLPLERRLKRSRLLVRAGAGIAGAILFSTLAAYLGLLSPVQALSPGTVGPITAGLAAGIAIAVLPRLGWLAAGAAIVGLALIAGKLAVALLMLATLALAPLVLPRSGPLWSLPAAAVGLALAGIPHAFCGTVARISGLWRRVAVAAVAVWWGALVTSPTGTHRHESLIVMAHNDRSLGATFDAVIARLVDPALVGEIALTAIAAAVVPYFVRGRSLRADAIRAAVWAIAYVGVLVAMQQRVAGETQTLALAAALSALLAAIFACGVARCDPNNR